MARKMKMRKTKGDLDVVKEDMQEVGAIRTCP